MKDIVIETPRLILRPPSAEDFGGFCELMADEVSARFIGGVQPRSAAWRGFLTMVGSWQIQGFGMFSVVLRDSGEWIGMTGLWHPEGFPERELGWDLAAHATGKGYATEAAIAARDHAYDNLGWTTLISLVADGNDASAKVAQRLGARPDGRFTHERFGPMNVWRHPKPVRQGKVA